nr:putative helix-turn-helix transcriptional regulator [uncultured bacterium]
MGNLSIAALGGALLGVTIALALFRLQGGRVYANRILAGSIILSVSYLLALVPTHSPDVSQIAFLSVGGLSVFLYGPALYLYVRAVTEHEFRLAPHHLVHGIPFLLVLMDRSHLFTALAGDMGILFYARRELLAVLYYSQFIAYLLATARLIVDFRQRIKESFSFQENMDLRWLGVLVFIALLFALLGFSFALVRWLFDVELWSMRIWSLGTMIVINYLIAFYAITRPMLFNPPVIERKSARYETSSLSAEQSDAIWARLQALMSTDQCYLENQLKIADLAQKLNMPVSHLSQTINQLGKCSFFNFVNGYRVEAAKAMLQAAAPGSRTMLDIALSAGFNSESAFYKQFRAKVGVTPRQFQQQS